MCTLYIFPEPFFSFSFSNFHAFTFYFMWVSVKIPVFFLFKHISDAFRNSFLINVHWVVDSFFFVSDILICFILWLEYFCINETVLYPMYMVNTSTTHWRFALQGTHIQFVKDHTPIFVYPWLYWQQDLVKEAGCWKSPLLKKSPLAVSLNLIWSKQEFGLLIFKLRFSNWANFIRQLCFSNVITRGLSLKAISISYDICQ